MDFKEWFELDEMAARQSLAHTMGKFWNNAKRPVAILTAFRKHFDLETNRIANKKLEQLFKHYGLSFYPVIGAGQERQEDGTDGVAEEESYVVSPIDNTMSEPDFVQTIKRLLFDPTGEKNIKFSQDSAVVKLPSRKDAFLLGHEQEEGPTSPEDYSPGMKLGQSARPRRGREMMVPHKDKMYPSGPDQYFTQMSRGPRASNTMVNAADTKPAGRRFTISRTKRF